MIVFDLCCAGGHRFEGWFGSSEDFARQRERDLVECPHCGSAAVEKAPMAPAVPRKGNQQPNRPPQRALASSGESVAMPREKAEALARLAQAQARALENSRWVGTRFAEESRAMHYGERGTETIHGRATADEAKALLSEGISIAPLPFPIAPPEKLN